MLKGTRVYKDFEDARKHVLARREALRDAERAVGDEEAALTTSVSCARISAPSGSSTAFGGDRAAPRRRRPSLHLLQFCCSCRLLTAEAAARPAA
jgi:hypothetical protein